MNRYAGYPAKPESKGFDYMCPMDRETIEIRRSDSKTFLLLHRLVPIRSSLRE